MPKITWRNIIFLRILVSTRDVVVRRILNPCIKNDKIRLKSGSSFATRVYTRAWYNSLGGESVITWAGLSAELKNSAVRPVSASGTKRKGRERDCLDGSPATVLRFSSAPDASTDDGVGARKQQQRAKGRGEVEEGRLGRLCLSPGAQLRRHHGDRCLYSPQFEQCPALSWTASILLLLLFRFLPFFSFLRSLTLFFFSL